MTDAVLLAQRLTMLLEGGRGLATYKLATLLALLDACAEAAPTPGSDDAFDVSILDLADRVIELYDDSWLHPKISSSAGRAVLDAAALRRRGRRPGAVGRPAAPGRRAGVDRRRGTSQPPRR